MIILPSRIQAQSKFHSVEEEEAEFRMEQGGHISDVKKESSESVKELGDFSEEYSQESEDSKNSDLETQSMSTAATEIVWYQELINSYRNLMKDS